MPIIKQYNLMIELKDGTAQHCLNNKSMEQEIAAINGNQSRITMHIIINALHFKSTRITFLDWSEISITPFLGQSPPPAPTKAQYIAIDKATAVANASSPPLSSADLAQAVTSGIAAMLPTPSGSGGGRSPDPKPSSLILLIST